MTQQDTDIARFCPGCGYDLRGIASDRCPECGTPFDPDQPTESTIPWSHRDTLGRRKAFWRTVKLATFSTRRFASEIHRPVSFDDAKAFRRAVVWRAFIPVSLVVIAAYLAGFELLELPWYHGDALGSALTWIGLPVLLTSVWLYLFFATGLPSYFFHPRSISVRQQNRSVALSYYAAAPYAFLFILPAMALVGVLLAQVGAFDDRLPILAVGLISLGMFLPAGILVLLIWLVPWRMLHQTVQASVARRVMMGFVVLPLGCLLCGIFTIGLVNLAYWGAALFVLSLE